MLVSSLPVGLLFDLAILIARTTPLEAPRVMPRSRISRYTLALALPLAACSSDDEGPPTVNLFDGYGSGSISVPARIAIPDLTPVTAGFLITSYTISPSLPAGLVIDPFTGVISGTAASVASAQTFLVTASDGVRDDTEPVTITVRNPIVGLSSDRALSVVRNIAGAPVSPMGDGVGLTGTAPAATVAIITEIDMPAAADAAVLAAADISTPPTSPVSSAGDATADFVATVTIDGSELDPADTWDFAAQAPYDDDGLAPLQPSFTVDTSTVVIEDGSLTLDVAFDDGTTTIPAFDSGTLTTSIRGTEPLTAPTLNAGVEWFAIGEDFYTEIANGAGQVEVFRFDADAGPGGGPALTEALDLDDATDGAAQIQGVVGGRLIVELVEPAMGLNKTYSYDPIDDTLVQVADLVPGGSDINGGYTDLDGDLYFLGVGPMGLSRVYRYTYASGGSPAALEAISSTSEGTDGDDPQDLTVFDGDLYFTALDGTMERHLYRFDPGTETQERLSAPAIGPVNNLTAAGGGLYATAQTAAGGEKLHVWNGVEGALQQLTDLTGDASQGDSIELLAAFDGRFFFAGDDGTSGRKLYRYSPGAAPQTIEQVSNTAGLGGDDQPSQLISAGNMLFFLADNDMGANKLYALDSSTDTVAQVCNINDDATDDGIAGLTPIGATRLAFSALLGTDAELFLYDLESGDTERAADVNNGASDEAFPVAELDGRAVFRAASGSGPAFYAVD